MDGAVKAPPTASAKKYPQPNIILEMKVLLIQQKLASANIGYRYSRNETGTGLSEHRYKHNKHNR